MASLSNIPQLSLPKLARNYTDLLGTMSSMPLDVLQIVTLYLTKRTTSGVLTNGLKQGRWVEGDATIYRIYTYHNGIAEGPALEIGYASLSRDELRRDFGHHRNGKRDGEWECEFLDIPYHCQYDNGRLVKRERQVVDTTTSQNKRPRV